MTIVSFAVFLNSQHKGVIGARISPFPLLITKDFEGPVPVCKCWLFSWYPYLSWLPLSMRRWSLLSRVSDLNTSFNGLISVGFCWGHTKAQERHWLATTTLQCLLWVPAERKRGIYVFQSGKLKHELSRWPPLTLPRSDFDKCRALRQCQLCADPCSHNIDLLLCFAFLSVPV